MINSSTFGFVFFIFFIDGTQTGTKISGLGGLGSNGSEGLLDTLQISWSETSPSDAVKCII